MQFKTRPARKIHINITSLIDVCFLLLIFLMISTTFLEQPGIKLSLPSAQTSDVEEMKDIVVEMTSDGLIALNGNSVTLDNLQKVLAENISKSANPALILKADEKVPHGQVVRVMDVARSAGIRRLVIATKKES